MKEIAIILGIVVGTAGGLIGLSTWAGEYYSSYQCSNYHDITGKPTTRKPLDSCYVQTDDGWMRWDEYKARMIASEGMR